MKRLLTLCIVLTAIALVSAPAFAEVQNVKVSGDVDTTAVYRQSYNLYPDSRSSSVPHDNFVSTQARARVDADLTDNVSATVQFLTEFDWNTEDNTGATANADEVNLDLANVTLKEAFYQPLTAIIGRQPLRYGNAFIIGDPDTNTTSADTANFTPTDLSLRKSFDAIRLILDYAPWTVDVIWSKIDETNTTKRDQDLYGVNLAYQFDTYNAEAEAYWFLSEDGVNTAPAPQGASTAAATLHLGNEIHTLGARGSVALSDALNLFGELAIQRGDYNNVAATNRDQDAVAYQVGGDYALNTTWNPVLRAGWTFYSGEGADNSGDHEAWIPLFEDQTHGVVANYILGGVNGGQNSNAKILNLGASAEPMQDLTVSLDFYNFWFDEVIVTSDNNTADGSGALGWTNLTEANYNMKAKDDVGYEIDLGLNYDYTEDVKMGLSAGWFVPKDAFDGEVSAAKNDETAVQVLATLDVAF